MSAVREAEARASRLDQHISDAAMFAAEAAAAVITGDLYQTEGGRWQVRKGGPSEDRLTQFRKHITPAIQRVADWWGGIRTRVDALPDPERDEFYDDVPPVEPDGSTGPGM